MDLNERIASAITDQENLILSAEGRIKSYLAELARQKCRIVVYQQDKVTGNCHVIVWGPDSDMDDIETALVRTNLPESLAEQLVDEENLPGINWA